MGRFLEAIDQGYIPTDGSAYLVVEQLDRLSRQSVSKASNLFQSILEKNVNIITLIDNKIYTKASLNNIVDIIHSILLMEQAFKESHKKGERVAQAFVGKVKRLKAGEKIKYSSMISAWLELKSDYKNIKAGSTETIFDLNGKEAIVQQCFNDYDNGLSTGEIAKKLNDHGVEKFGRKRQQSKTDTGVWTGANISHMFRQTAVLGRLDVKTWEKREIDGIEVHEETGIETIEGYYPQIISLDLWNRVEARKAKARTTMERGRKSTRNIFTSLIYCADCFKRFHFENDEKMLKGGLKKYSLLKCSSRRFKNKNGCPSISVNYENFEKELIRQIRLFDNREISPKAQRALDKTKEKVSTIDSEIIKINKKLEALENEFETSEEYGPTIFLQVSSKLKKSINEKKRERELLERQIIDFKPVESREYDLTVEADRESAKAHIKSIVAGIVLSTEYNRGWVIYKDGDSHTFSYGQGNFTKSFRKITEFMKELKQANEEGRADLKLVNILQAMELWDLSHEV
ncbi:MAG: recombinase family protein [Proteobacteria bacterium]|nr:recombinase family protein [Pseudomonadota bacterium]